MKSENINEDIEQIVKSNSSFSVVNMGICGIQVSINTSVTSNEMFHTVSIGILDAPQEELSLMTGLFCSAMCC